MSELTVIGDHHNLAVREEHTEVHYHIMEGEAVLGRLVEYRAHLPELCGWLPRLRVTESKTINPMDETGNPVLCATQAEALTWARHMVDGLRNITPAEEAVLDATAGIRLAIQRQARHIAEMETTLLQQQPVNGEDIEALCTQMENHKKQLRQLAKLEKVKKQRIVVAQS